MVHICYLSVVSIQTNGKLLKRSATPASAWHDKCKSWSNNAPTSGRHSPVDRKDAEDLRLQLEDLNSISKYYPICGKIFRCVSKNVTIRTSLCIKIHKIQIMLYMYMFVCLCVCVCV